MTTGQLQRNECRSADLHGRILADNLAALASQTDARGRSFEVIPIPEAYDVEATAPDGSTIEVSPRRFNLAREQSAELDITITASTASGQQFGEIRLVPRTAGFPTLHLPVAFVPQQGDVSLTSACAPTEIARGTDTRCTITATNLGGADTTVDLTTSVDSRLRITQAIGATVVEGRARLTANLVGDRPGVPAVDPGALFGYVPLDGFGGTIVAPVGDESIVNFNVPAFDFNGRTFTRFGVDSNGYLVAGGATAEDNECCTLPTGPNPARPNNFLAPFWTDLNGTGAPGILVNVLSNASGNDWIVVEWRVNVFGTTDQRRFQAWIGLNDDADPRKDITFAYAAAQANPAGQPFLVGAENELGQGDVTSFLPTTSQRVTSSPPTPGGTASYVVVARGEKVGAGVVTTEMVSAAVAGITVVRSTVQVTRR